MSDFTYTFNIVQETTEHNDNDNDFDYEYGLLTIQHSSGLKYCQRFYKQEYYIHQDDYIEAFTRLVSCIKNKTKFMFEFSLAEGGKTISYSVNKIIFLIDTVKEHQRIDIPIRNTIEYQNVSETFEQILNWLKTN